MAMVTGRVEKVFSKEFKPGKWMYSIVINGTFYGTGSRKPTVVEGDNVKFEASENGKYWNVEGNIEVTGQAPASSGGGGTTAAPAQNDRQLFEERKQKAIALQSARNTALTAVDILLRNGGIKLPTKQGDVTDVILALADEMTTRYFDEVQDIYSGGTKKVRDKAAASTGRADDDFEDDISRLP